MSYTTSINVSVPLYMEEQEWRRKCADRLGIPFKECVECGTMERHDPEDYLCWICRDKVAPYVATDLHKIDPVTATTTGSIITINITNAEWCNGSTADSESAS